MVENMGKEANKNYDKFQKQVEELRKKSTSKKDVDEFIKTKGIQKPPKPYEVTIEFENVIELSSKNILEIKNLSYGYSIDKIIFNNIEFGISMGDRNIIVGSNGVGKTTLFRLINGIIDNFEGDLIRDTRLRVAHYHQQIIDNLPLELTPIAYLQSLNSSLESGMCRSILGKLGIKKTETIDLPNTKISILSGGQKARVSFATIQMLNPHLLLMDEPTNHLDSQSIEGLIKGINEFNGAIIIITHDMYLIESIENSTIYEIINKKIKKFNGNFDEYCNKALL
jgi:ATPase subunit of ABC transporter with duplicated ATPase domains